MLVLDGKTLVYDRPFSHDGINYPANWLRLTTLAEKEAIGITEVPDTPQPAYDQRFYWGPGLPKDLDDLKSLWIKKQKRQLILFSNRQIGTPFVRLTRTKRSLLPGLTGVKAFV